MAKRTRRGTLTVGSAVPGLVDLTWDDAYEFDRTRADDEYYGVPVMMSKSGSASVALLAGAIPSGYATSNPVFVYTEIEQAGGVETKVTKTVTFFHATFNAGGNFGDGAGRKNVKMDYSYHTEV